MATQNQYAPGEVVERGEKLYEERIRQQVERDNLGKYLVINVETRQWELGEDHSEAILRTLANINSTGQVVGSADIARSYTPGDRYKLIRQLPPTIQPVGINDKGQIAGFGLIKGQTHACLLIPKSQVQSGA